jgi:hypothetical protein
LASGGSQLEMLAQTTVQDTGRAAVSAGMIARPHVEGLRAGAHAAVLLPVRDPRRPRHTGGRRASNATRAATAHVAPPTSATEEPPSTRWPRRAGQVRGLSKAEEAAISDGADLNQIVNAHRSGAYQGMTTAEGVTRRGVAGKRLRGRQRLTVGAIQRLASDRAEMTALLRTHGYLI